MREEMAMATAAWRSPVAAAGVILLLVVSFVSGQQTDQNDSKLSVFFPPSLAVFPTSSRISVSHRPRQKTTAFSASLLPLCVLSEIWT